MGSPDGVATARSILAAPVARARGQHLGLDV